MDRETGDSRGFIPSGESLYTNEICLYNDSLYFFIWVFFHTRENPDTLPRSLEVSSTSGNSARTYVELPQDARTAPAAHAGTVYFGGNRGLYAIDIETMTLKWEFVVDCPVLTSPSIAEDLIYFGSDDGALYVLNKDTGELVRKLETTSGLPVRTSPALWDGQVYFSAGDTLYSWGSAEEASEINKVVIV